MLNLLNYLTPEDNKIISDYIQQYGVKESYVGNNKYLKYWADNKKKLFRLLGGQLILKIPYSYVESDESISLKIVDHIHDYKEYYNRLDAFFYNSLKKYFNYDINFVNDTSYTLAKLFNYSKLKNNNAGIRIKIKIPNKKKTLQISENMKTMKAIQKTLIYFNAPQEIMDIFEQIRLQHSQIYSTKAINKNLCFSIHPMDFLTMSDNASGWKSCMSLKYQGSYSIGPIEMMNSNNIICVYLEDSKPYNFGENSWNSKMWRQLFVCTKDILVNIRSYPFEHENATITALNELKKLAQENWHRNYQYGIEKYRDMKHIDTLYRVERNRDWIYNGEATKKNIIFDTKGMYNDFLNCGNMFYCYRNKVKKNKIISYSGKAPCACCMKSILKEKNYDIYDPDSYNDRFEYTDILICSDCGSKYICEECNKIDPAGLRLHEGKKICRDCQRAYLSLNKK